MCSRCRTSIIKSINGGYAVSQIVFVRCLVAIPLLLIVTHFEGGLRTLWSRQIGLNVLRGGIMFVAYTTYYLALAALPLAETVALGMSSPLFITALSFPLLGERVGCAAVPGSADRICRCPHHHPSRARRF